MEIRLTLVDPGGSPVGVDVAVHAPPGTRLGDVLGQLEHALPFARRHLSPPVTASPTSVASGPCVASGLSVESGLCVASELPTAGRTTRVAEAGVTSAWCGGRLGEDAVLGRPPLLDGAVVTLRKPDDPGGGRAPDVPPAQVPATRPSPGPPAPRASDPTAGRPAGLALHVVAGPDAGSVLALAPGPSALGRGPDARLRLVDRDVSRRHALVTVDADAVTLADLASTNGTTVDRGPGGPPRGEPHHAAAEQVREEPVEVQPGDRIRAGSTTLVLRRGDDLVPAAVTPDGEGHLLLNRVSRLIGPPREVRVEYPATAAERPPHRPAWPLLLLPLVVAVPMAVIWHQPAFLLLAVASPLAALAQHLVERRAARRERATAAADHARSVVEVDAAVTDALDTDLARRLVDHPDLAELLVAARTPTTRVWQRRLEDADALVVRVGTGRVPSRVQVLHPTGSTGPGPRGPAATGPGTTGPGTTGPGTGYGVTWFDDAPVTLDLRRHGVIGLAGEAPEAAAVARALLAQVAVLCSPAEVTVEVLAAPGRERAWAWVRWLPHAADPPRSPALGSGGGRLRLVVLDGAESLRRRPEVAELLARAAATGASGRGAAAPGTAGDAVVCLCLDGDVARLPVECSTAVLVADGVGQVHRRGDDPIESVSLEAASPAWAQTLARALAPLRDATPAREEAGLPADVDLLEVLRDGDAAAGVPGVDLTDPAAVAALWRRGRRSAVVLGRTADGPWVLDLAKDGPHALVAGTTGAGKSALLRSLVVALAAANSPEDLAFVLVDYKGGAAFAGCGDLPHVTGVVTDLDGALTRRALSSLRAELRSREAVLRAAGVTDATAYAALRARAPGRAPMPRLVLVVDEFAVLAEELPEFVDGLVRIAAVGRSLGVHLVLATQRPGGVVSAGIRANTSLRVALRVREAPDSLDVIEAPDAAAIPADRPGRAMVRAGDGRLRAVQVARLRPPRREESHRPRVRLLDSPSGAAPAGAVAHLLALAVDRRLGAELTDGQSTDDGRTDDGLGAAAAVIRKAADLVGSHAATPPWLPPLPDRLPWSHLAGLEGHGTANGSKPARASATTKGAATAIGLLDLPELQAQRPWGWDLAHRAHLAVVGGPRSGRTTTLLAVGAACAGQAAVYAVDAGPGCGTGAGAGYGEGAASGPGGRGGLAALVGAAHVGAVVPATDLERCSRLLELLAGRARGGADAPDPLTGGRDQPPCVLLVDGWEAVAQAWEATRLLDSLVALLRDGPGSGLLAALSGGRTLLTGPVAALLGQRLLLRMSDAMEATMAGLRPRDIPRHQPPGRALLLHPDGPLSLQIALPQITPTDDGAVAGHTDPGAPPPPLGVPPLGVPALPRRVMRSDLNPPCRPGKVPTTLSTDIAMGVTVAMGVGVTVAAGGAMLTTAALPLHAPGLFVVGGAGYGRSTALAGLAEALAGQGTPVVVLSGATATDVPSAVASLERRFADAPPDRGVVVLVDDAATLAAPVEEVLLRHCGAGGLVVAACGTQDAARAFRGLLALLRDARRALVLGPTAGTDTDWLGVRFPVPASPLPGRGWLVDSGRVAPVQVALPARRTIGR